MRGPLIIGGGPAGAAAASLIAAAGHPVTVIERSTGPTDKVCGDFLSAGALAALAAHRVDPVALGGARIDTVRFVHRSRVAEARLPFPAVSLSRRVLDEAMLTVAASRGATILRGESIHGLAPDSDGFSVRGANATFHADSVFLATGKHDLRGHARPKPRAAWLGLKMYYKLAPAQQAALRGATELHLVRGGYAGLQDVGQGRCALCVVLHAARYRRDGGNWGTLLDDLAGECPVLAARLAGATACLERPLAVAGIPYGHLYRPNPAAPSGLFRIGDQVCVVPSLVGDGLAMALHSAGRAAALWLGDRSAADFHAGLRRQAVLPLRFATALHAICSAGWSQPLAVAACRAWPPALQLAAALGRVAPLA